MAKYTREDIVRIVKEEDVKFIRLQFTDTFGHMKNVAITVSQLEKCLDNRPSKASCVSRNQTCTCVPISIPS